MLTQQQRVTVLTTLSPDTIAALRRQIHGCEMCSTEASFPFGELLMRLTGCRNGAAGYVVSGDLHCPSCITPLEPETLVELQAGIGQAARHASAMS